MAEKKPSPKKPTVVRKITKVTKPMTKSAVKNPSAPRGTGSGTSVKVITPSETFMKKGKAKGMNTPPGAKTKNYKSSNVDKMIANSQTLLKRGTPPANKGGKPSQVTPPKKKTPPAPKQKRRIFTGRGGSMRGGSMGGGMGFPGNVNQ